MLLRRGVRRRYNRAGILRRLCTSGSNHRAVKQVIGAFQDGNGASLLNGFLCRQIARIVHQFLRALNLRGSLLTLILELIQLIGKLNVFGRDVGLVHEGVNQEAVGFANNLDEINGKLQKMSVLGLRSTAADARTSLQAQKQDLADLDSQI
ncbi:hypothetical protein ACT4UM_21235, partial [Bacillus sp. SS-TM]